MLDWDDLRHFVALADEGTLAGAARRLRVEHATVARRVSALEARVGVRLVDRRPRRYVLTAAGRRVAEHARRMEAEAFALARAARGDPAAAPVEVAASMPLLIATHLVAPHLGELAAARPGLRLRLVGESRTAALARGEADIAIRLSRPADETLVARRLGKLVYRLYASPAYLRGRKPERYGFVTFDDSLGEFPQQTWLNGLIGGRPVVLRTNDLAIQCAAARAGMGVAVLPEFAAEAAGLRPAGPPDETTERELWLAYHRELRGNADVAACVAFLARCLGRRWPPADRSGILSR
jgi:DNA-binding transcriptional LysR family regulator